MIIQSINQGKIYASYWLTNYRNQIFTPFFGTMGMALGEGEDNKNNNKPRKQKTVALIFSELG